MKHRLMSLYEAANYLKIGYQCAYNLAVAGKLPAFKMGGHWRVAIDKIDFKANMKKETKNEVS